MRLFSLFALFILISAPALAQVQVTAVSRLSDFEKDADGNFTKLYGGIAGSCVGTTTTTCNSCTIPDSACNPVRIHSTLELRIDFKITADISGVVSVGVDFSGSFNSINPENVTSGTLNNGDTGVVEIQWTDICNIVTSGNRPLCEAEGGSGNLIIGLATNSSTEPASGSFVSIPIEVVIPNADITTPAADGFNLVDCADLSPSTGICDLLAFPGDEKVFIDDLQEVGAWPQSNTVNVKALRIYYSTVDFVSANYDTSTYVDIPLDSEGVPISDVVGGLTNDVLHFFRPAIVDDANNVAFLVDINEIRTDPNCDTTGAFDDSLCTLSATPSAVLGLLTEDLNCFISTVAFGSQMSEEVQSFRNFRNKFLLRSDWGQKLVKLYYSAGPKMARFISEHSYLKPLVRVGLQPLAFLAKQSNRYGIHIFFLGLLAALFTALGFIIGGRKLWRSF